MNVIGNVCPFCHALIVQNPPLFVNGDTVDFAWHRAAFLHEQNIRDHVRLEHPAVWPLVSRLAKEAAEARA